MVLAYVLLASLMFLTCSPWRLGVSTGPCTYTLNCNLRYVECAGVEGPFEMCTGLKRLLLVGCLSLARLVLSRGEQLVQLNLEGCHALRTLACASPALRTLSVHRCGQLEVEPWPVPPPLPRRNSE